MKKMLIIDDNLEFRNMMSDYFGEFGFEVAEADNGTKGLEMAKEILPDIIFLDVMMPDIGGIEVLRRLQTEDETTDIPVLVITGTYFEKNMNDLFKLEPNCFGFMSKTTEITIVQKKMEEVLAKKKNG